MLESLFKKNSGNISGISNFCDRWCERCKFTSRCANFKFSQKLEALIKEDLDEAENPDFTVHASFEIVPAKGFHFPPDDDEDEEEEAFDEAFKEAHERKQNRVKEHQLTRLSDIYCKSVFEIIKSRDRSDFLSGIGMDAELAGQLEASQTPDLFKILSTKHEPILRFSVAVHIKLRRALDDWFDLIDGEGDSDFNRTDMNGTARLVLVMIDEMVEEWIKLKDAPEAFKHDIDRIFDELLRLRDLTEQQFPEARVFVRPGIDEVGKGGGGSRQ